MDPTRAGSEGDGPEFQPEVLGAGWLGVPTVPRGYRRRGRLVELLDRSESLPLVLVSAPAGSGKTWMVADWVAWREDGAGTEWVTFENGDEAFWPGIVRGLARLGVAVPALGFPVGTAAVDRATLISLAAAVAKHPAPVRLVVDGYEMASGEVAGDFDFLLRHSGHRLHVVLVTRADPVLPLYRYRLQGTLAEVRMADLAFTDAEAAELVRAAGVTLTRASVHALNLRTEGWAAGLRFAAQFLEQSDDPDRAVADVAGDNGNIAEYLMGEVLATQTPEVHDLLLSTSIAETLSPGLAEALGGPSAARTLAILSRANAFVEPVPEHPGFYRYHPFFRDLLRAELGYESPDQMHRLQRRAAQWFAHEGLLAASVSHYAAIDAWAEAAAEVVDALAIGEVLLTGGQGKLARALGHIPDDVADAPASVVRATLALSVGNVPRFVQELADVPDPSEPAEDAHQRAVSVAVAVLRAVHAQDASDPRAALDVAEAAGQALTECGRHSKAKSRPELFALVDASRGIATLRQGQLSAARDHFAAGAGAATGLGAELVLVDCLGHLALIACVEDQLSDAQALATRATAVADRAGVPVTARPPTAEVALAWVDLERYDLAAATEHARSADVSDTRPGALVARTLLTLVRSRLQAAQGDVKGGLRTVEDASSQLTHLDRWLDERLRLEAAHLRIANGEPAVALVEVEGLEDHCPADVALVIACALLQQGEVEATREALTRVFVPDISLGVEVGGWLAKAEYQVQQGQFAKASSALDRALRLAAREGLRRPFREARPTVAALLAGDARQGSASQSWLNIPRHVASGTAHARAALPHQVQAPSSPPLIDRLTEKELEVLGHLAELLTTEEIAATMFVSVNTIRTHVRSILRKLGVPRRNAAVRRARELGLLPV